MTARRRALLALALLGPAARTRAEAAPPELAIWPHPGRVQGQARFRWFGLHVYDVRLWVPQPVPAERWHAHPLALELVYARALDGRAIAERSLAEMRRQGEIDRERAAAWMHAMRRAIPDVRAGDRLCGVHEPGLAARFFHNGQATAEVADARFAAMFFGIWLSVHTSEPELRRALLAGAA